MYSYKLWTGLSDLLQKTVQGKATGPYSKLLTKEALNSSKYRHGVYLLTLKREQHLDEKPKKNFMTSIFHRQRTVRRAAAGRPGVALPK
mmetsp:Transcript_32204/g.49252  ORF Transcript_32204/g.49252 Transcript_32204/m.49252 type:complete len:89 (-) Transcript_32204:1429-1695(-)